ncbi:DMT family transporter [Streptomyces sp. TM32]|uniref:DMT family transporter n=1 Tax=Streptomyces sp. TM32 TaxID=1652669 RepID=UPI0013869C44|nr:DMT family transporter [Streptomyces sp. TM32]
MTVKRVDLQFLGLQHTGAADAILLDGLQSALVLVMGVIFIKEAVTRRSVAGVLVATVGAALLTGAHFTLSGSIGDALVLLGALGASASVIVVSRLAAEASALELTACQFGFGFLFTIPVMASYGAPAPRRFPTPRNCRISWPRWRSDWSVSRWATSPTTTRCPTCPSAWPAWPST